MTPNDITAVKTHAQNCADLAAVWATLQVLNTLPAMPSKGRYLTEHFQKNRRLAQFFWTCYNAQLTLPPAVNTTPNATGGRRLPILALLKGLANGTADGKDCTATMRGIPVESRLVVHSMCGRDLGGGCTPLLVHRALVKAGLPGLPGIATPPPS